MDIPELLKVERRANRILVDGRSKQDVGREGGTHSMLVEGEQIVVGRRGGANRMFVERGGQTGC